MQAPAVRHLPQACQRGDSGAETGLTGFAVQAAALSGLAARMDAQAKVGPAGRLSQICHRFDVYDATGV